MPVAPKIIKKVLAKKKNQKLTLKQKGFVQDVLITGNGTEAAMRNYGLKNRIVAKSVASENLAKPYIASAIAEALEDDLLAKRHKELLNKREYRIEYVKKGKKTVAVRVDDGPDSFAVKAGLDMAYKIKGTYAPEKQAIVHAHIVADEDKKRIDNILKENE